MLILEHHALYVSTAFKDAAKEQNIDLLFLPAHSPHMLQPQDDGYFHVVKQRVAELHYT
jgi:hypothetical protein